MRKEKIYDFFWLDKVEHRSTQPQGEKLGFEVVVGKGRVQFG